MNSDRKTVLPSEKKKKLPKGKQTIKETLLNENTPFHVREAYKALRTNVMFSVSAESGKVVGITSSMPSEEKSTTALNLAITFAETGNKVILIDADLRRPNIKRILDADSAMGLAEVLANFSAASDVIQPSPYKNLDILYSGAVPPNPVELLGSQAMERMIGSFKTDYDYIFIDTPPVNVVTDATVLAKVLDGMILVIRENSSKRDEVLYAVNKLQFVNTKIIGVVLNDKAFHNKRSYSSGKYKSYYKQSYDESKND